MDKRTLSRLGVIHVFGCGYLISTLLVNSTNAARSCKNCVSTSADDDKHNDDSGKLYPIQTFFVNTGETMADEMAHHFARYGKYHNYLKVSQIKSKFCLGHTVILKVSTDDTTFFN